MWGSIICSEKDPGSYFVQVKLLSAEHETLWEGSWSSVTSVPWGTGMGRKRGHAVHKPHFSTGLTSGPCTLSYMCMLCAPRNSLTGQLCLSAQFLYSVVLHGSNQIFIYELCLDSYYEIQILLYVH
jgi:hypothetical protein